MPFRRLPALSALRTFESAARLSSFKAAAEELFVTPGAVSQQVRGLEEDLGVKLFDRAPRAVTLTDEGRRLQTVLNSAFRDIRAVLQEISQTGSTEFEITCTPPVASKWLAPRLSRFADAFPEVFVRVHSSFEAEDLDVDGTRVAIRTYSGKPPAELYTKKICDEVLVPLASPRLVSELKLTDPHDIVRAQLLHDSSLSDSGWASPWGDWFENLGLPREDARRGINFARYSDQALDAAVNGAGVVLGRSFIASHDIDSGRLVSPFGPQKKTSFAYYLTCLPEVCKDPVVTGFFDWVLKESARARPMASAQA